MLITQAMMHSYKGVAERFTHMDADFVACSLGFPEDRPFYRVRFYPWWEHPQYLDAVEAGGPWGFVDVEEGAREVTIHPIELITFRISNTNEVTDWFFTDTGPYLWDHEPAGQIFLNGPIDRDEFLARVEQRLKVGRLALDPVIAPPIGVEWEPPFSLRLPRSLLLAAMDALDEAGVPYHRAYVPPAPEWSPVAFVIDDSDYIIARDFELDVPEFEHRAEWFRPPT